MSSKSAERALFALTALLAAAAARGQARGVELAELHHMLPTISERPIKIVVGDVDGDGQQDLVLFTVDYATGHPVVWHATGACRYVPIADALPEMRFANNSYPSVIAGLADLDGDGDRDLVTVMSATCSSNTLSSCTGGAIEVFTNDGTGHFSRLIAAVPQDPSALMTSLALGDVDGDGDTDLVVGCAPFVIDAWPLIFLTATGQEKLFLNDGTGHFTAVSWAAGVDFDWTSSVLLADFDNDGDLDLHVTNSNHWWFGGGQDTYYSNNGTGTFTRIVTALPIENSGPPGSLAVDFDSDGDLDIVLNNYSSLSLLRNNGTGVFTDASAGFPWSLTNANAIFCADFDGNGTVDIGVLSINPFGADRILQFSNNGSGVFTYVPSRDRYALDSTDFTALAALDVDGDADVDLIAPHIPGFVSGLFLNDGTGAWTEVPGDMPSQGGGSNQRGDVAVDIDGDGDLDVLACGLGAHRVYRNNGAGRFTSVPYGAFTASTASTKNIAIGDLDGDSLPDVVVASGYSPPFSSIYRNNGAGSLDLALTTTIDAAAVALGDVDNDGDLDIYFGTSGADRVFRNLGGMTFAEIPGAVVDPVANSCAKLADIDGDGDLDAVLAGINVSNRVLRNDGTGVFTEIPNAMPQCLGYVVDLAVGDFDGDGDNDVVVANGGGFIGQPNRFYRNDGTGIFADSSADIVPVVANTSAIAAVDLDRDGDLDLC